MNFQLCFLRTYIRYTPLTQRIIYTNIVNALTTPKITTAIPISSIFALPVNPAGVGVAVELVPVAVELASKAAQLEKFCPPKNTPTVVASPRWILCKRGPATVAFVAQKLMVKFIVLARPLQLETTVVPS